MNRIVWTEDVGQFAGERVFFDTNVWIMIEGFNQGAPPRKVSAYSRAYEELLRNGNEIVVSDYVVNEFMNVCSRMLFSAAQQGGREKMRYKDYRRTEEFRTAMALIEASCLNIIESSTFVPTVADADDAVAAVEAACRQGRDFADTVVARFCERENLVLMTDDADFARSPLRLISANRAMANAR